jgi:hypothetical protein
MYEFDEGAELSKSFYEPENIKVANGLYVTDAAEKQQLEEENSMETPDEPRRDLDFFKNRILRIEKRKLTYS